MLKKMVRDRGLAGRFEIASAATTTEEIWGGRGNPVYPPARKVLLQHGIDPAGKHAVLMQRSDYERYDYLIGMDTANIRNMTRIAGGDPDNKIYKLLSFADSGRDIADPWYTGNFDETYEDILEGCTAFLKKVQK